MTAGAIVLAVIAPVAESSERPADAGAIPPSVAPRAAETPEFDPIATLGKRPTRASRAVVRRAAPSRPAVRRGLVRQAAVQVKRQERKHKPERLTRQVRVVRHAARTENETSKARPRVKPRRTKMRTFSAVRPGMGAVIAFARSQVGKAYATGGEGPHYFDCSGLTKRAYALAGIRLPHSSGGQAARARSIPRSLARPGDLVVGPGHVGVYMGGGMMIDAGNRRTGVVYRKLYAGLHIERL